MAVVDGEQQLEADDDTFAEGRIALVATTTCMVDSAEVTAPDEVHAAYVQARTARERELDELREQYPKPVARSVSATFRVRTASTSSWRRTSSSCPATTTTAPCAA